MHLFLLFEPMEDILQVIQALKQTQEKLRDPVAVLGISGGKFRPRRDGGTRNCGGVGGATSTGLWLEMAFCSISLSLVILQVRVLCVWTCLHWQTFQFSSLYFTFCCLPHLLCRLIHTFLRKMAGVGYFMELIDI